MNWDAIGATAEIIGAIGVILSLIYLAIQIRANSDNISQNTKAILANTEISSNDQILEIYKPQIESAEVAALARKGHAGIDELDDTERHRYSMLVRGIFETHQTYFVQQKRGTTGPEIWEFHSRSFDNFCTFPGIITWWEKHKATFDPEYAKYINAKIPCDS